MSCWLAWMIGMLAGFVVIGFVAQIVHHSDNAGAE